MQKTVRELISMYKTIRSVGGESNSLYTEQSTQRGYIYKNIKNERTGLSKAAEVIKSMLERKIKLPALYFWSVQDDDANVHYLENEYNITDGKQRFLSIYNFYRGTLTTQINGEEINYDLLDDDLKEEFLNYTFDIVVRTGTLKEEEQTFFYLNTTGEPLTDYEGLRGAYHGTFLYGFERYIDTKARILNNINTVDKDRGDQASWLLYLYFDEYNLNSQGNQDAKDTKVDVLLSRTKDDLSLVRNNRFDPTYKNFESKLMLYNDLCTILSGSKGKSPQKLYRVVKYIIDNNLNINVIKGYFTEIIGDVNDLAKWQFEQYRCAIDALFKKPSLRLDGRRFFNDDDKQTLYNRSNTCVECGKVLNFKEATVDHTTAWKNGGRTNLENAQLMCREHNSAKNDN